MNLEQQFTMLIYPFVHTVSGSQRQTRLSLLEERWFSWWRRFASSAEQPDLEDALDDTYFFLPSMRNLLFPETVLLGADATRHVAEMEQLRMLPAATLARRLHADGAIRLTYCQQLMDTFGELHLALRRAAYPSVSIRLCWLDALLFPHGIGFLVLKVRVLDAPLEPEKLIAALSQMRLVLKPTITWDMPAWESTSAGSFGMQDLVDFWLQGMTGQSNLIDQSFTAFLERARSGANVERYTSTPDGQVYGQQCRLYSYTCLDADESTRTGEPRPHGSDAPATGSPETTAVDMQPLFRNDIERTLYELATCSTTASGPFRPHIDGVARLMKRGHIALWENWQAMVLHDSAVFLGAASSPFTRGALPHNVESDYLQLYVLALYQKVLLNVLSSQLMRRRYALSAAERVRSRLLPGWSFSARHSSGNLREARHLWNDFVMFRNHYWQSEVSFRPQGNDLYRRFHSGLDVQPLYDAVYEQVRELQEYYEERAQRRLGYLLGFITFVGVPLSLIIDVFSGIAVSTASGTPWRTFGTAVGAGVVVTCLLFGWWAWWSRE